MKLNIAVDVDQWRMRLGLFDKRQRLITAIALTKAAKEVEKAEIVTMQTVFDRPTRWTLGAFYVSPATPEKLEARIGAKDFAGKGTPAWKYLRPNVYGGQRGYKSFEKLLHDAGHLPSGMKTVPSKNVSLDQNGNMSTGLLRQIMSQLRLQRGGGYDANLSRNPKAAAKSVQRQGGRIFVGRPGGGKLPLGVWQRKVDGKLVPLLLFVREPVYRPRFPFYDTAQLVGRIAFKQHYEIERNRERPMKRAA